MSNSINPLINFDRPQEHAIDSALVQALDSYEAAQVPHHLQQSHNLGRQQVHPHQHRQQLHQQNNGQLQHKQHDQSNDQRLLQQVPIDPSINDSTSEKNAAVAAAAAAAAAANDMLNARNTAQAAVNSSSKMNNSRNNSASTGPKITKPRINKPGQKFGAKKKSWVWNWFIQDTVDSNVATCDFCGKVIKRLASDKGSPKKLGEHLKTHKIDKNSINPKRDSMIVGDANRHYFNTLNAAQTFKPHPLSNQPSSSNSQSQQSHSQQSQQQNNHQTLSQNSPYSRQQTTGASNTNAEFTNTNYDRSGFDQNPYSQPKFQKDIMKFLVENKLPLAIVKSPSFRQVIFTLKPEAIPDLNELNHLYSSLLEVIHNEKGPLSNVDDVNNDQQNDSADHQTSRHDDSNVDDSLTASTSGWV